MRPDKIERLTAAVEAKGVDIAPSYAEWLRLAFAIDTEMGENGKKYFRRLSALHVPSNTEDKIEKMWSSAHKNNKRKCSLGTFFFLAKKYGVLCASEADEWRREVVETVDAERDEEGEGAMPSTVSPPTIQQYIPKGYEWPEPIRSTLASFKDDRDRDVMLMGLLTVLGSTCARFLSFEYGKVRHTNMHTVIFGRSGCGKGKLPMLKHFVSWIDDIFDKENEAEQQRVREELRRAKEDDDPAPVEPAKTKCFTIPGDTYGAGLKELLRNNKGTGIIFETEAQTIVQRLKAGKASDWSDTLRKTFDNEEVRSYRKTTHELTRSGETYLSMLVSGTPGQVKSMIDNSEDGLFSRVLFYYLDVKRQWRNVYEDNLCEVDKRMSKLGERWSQYIQRTRCSKFTLTLTPGQKQRLFEVFNAMTEQNTEDAMTPFIQRLAIGAIKIMAILSFIRRDNPLEMLVPGKEYDMSVDERDFEAVLAMVRPLYLHALFFLDLIPDNGIKSSGKSKTMIVLESMPETFMISEVVKAGEEKGISQGAMRNYISKCANNGTLKKGEMRGQYIKRHT